MTKTEVYALLRQAFGLEKTLSKYELLEPLDGLREAIAYWDWAKEMQDGATGDKSWWQYENEKTMAYVLMGIYCWRVLGHDDFPPLPDAAPEVLADSHAHLCLWSRSLVLDHVHKWISDGGDPVCGICGEERFDPQPMVNRARELLRESKK